MASCDRSFSILCFSSEILVVFVWNFRNIKNVFKLTPFRERLITMKLGDQQQIELNIYMPPCKLRCLKLSVAIAN